MDLGLINSKSLVKLSCLLFFSHEAVGFGHYNSNNPITEMLRLLVINERGLKNINKTVILIDYDNVWISCKEEYGVDIVEINFIEKLKNHLVNKENLFILEIIAYGNFDNGRMATDRHQSLLQINGIQTRHVMNGKDSADIAIVCDAIEKLYVQKEIETFVIASCDRDITSLVNKIKSQGKKVFLLPLAVNIDWDVISNYGDKHIWFEEILDIPYTKPKFKTELNEAKFLQELDKLTSEKSNVSTPLLYPKLTRKYNTTRTKIYEIKDRLLKNNEIENYAYNYNGKTFHNGIRRKIKHVNKNLYSS